MHYNMTIYSDEDMSEGRIGWMCQCEIPIIGEVEEFPIWNPEDIRLFSELWLWRLGAIVPTLIAQDAYDNGYGHHWRQWEDLLIAIENQTVEIPFYTGPNPGKLAYPHYVSVVEKFVTSVGGLASMVPSFGRLEEYIDITREGLALGMRHHSKRRGATYVICSPESESIDYRVRRRAAYAQTHRTRTIKTGTRLMFLGNLTREELEALTDTSSATKEIEKWERHYKGLLEDKQQDD